MAQQGRNNNTYGFDELAFWRPIDAENRPVYRAVLRESRAIQDEAQDILNRFAGLSMMGLLPKAQVERLHRDIARWKKQGESTGELRLLMQDAQRRTRMRCDEAMLLYLMHAISDSYARISETDRGALLSASRIAYKRAFAEGNEITRLGAKSVPGAKFVRDTLSNNPLPTGLTYEQALAADAAYRAREITKQAVVDSSQGKELSMDSEPMQAILRRQRAWQLREVQKTPEGRFAGYYDMVMGFIVGHTVVQAFMDAGVKAYRFIATIDDRTTSECRALHGKVFRMEELKLGINAPPVYPPPHPCRSVIQAVEVESRRGAGGDDGQPGAIVHEMKGHIDPNDHIMIEKLVKAFCKQYAKSPVENMLVITKEGEIHFITDNNPKGVDSSYLGDKMKGSYNIHTHPPDSTQFSFSTEIDMPNFFEDGSAVMEAVDYKYRYRFERPEWLTWEKWDKARAEAGERLQDILEIRCKPDYSDYEDLCQHCLMEETCRILGINCYTRWER